MATGQETSSDETELKSLFATCLAPTPVEPSYENVRESEVYLEVL